LVTPLSGHAEVRNINVLEKDEADHNYAVPFAVQWAWPAILLPILIFAPESPWHLVRKRRLVEAEHSLLRLKATKANINVKETLAIIVHTNQLEEELAVGTSYWDCFRGFERRRTEIACLAFAGQVLSGSSFAYNSTYFFAQVGLASKTTYDLNTGGTVRDPPYTCIQMLTRYSRHWH